MKLRYAAAALVVAALSIAFLSEEPPPGAETSKPGLAQRESGRGAQK